MFKKSLQSIPRISLSYVLLNNIHSNLTRSSINSTISVGYHYQAERRQKVRRFGNRSTWTFNLPATSSFVNKPNFSFINRCVSSGYIGDLNKMLNYLPYFASGEIVAGFGRGSKELGIPTANYPLDVVKALPESFNTGVYYGWAKVDNGPVYKMVMSIGWNPFYDNNTKSMETHILHEFNRDLYGCLLKICIVGFLRPEQNFKSLEDLIAAIKDDITNAEKLLDSNEDHNQLKQHQFFHDDAHVNSKSNNRTST